MIEYNYVDSPLSLQSSLQMLVRRKKLITGVFLIMIVTLVLGTLLIPPSYQASSKILIELEKNSEKALLFKINNWDAGLDYDRIATEMEIIGNRTIAEKVVDHLQLNAPAAQQNQDRHFSRELAIAKLQRGLKIDRAKNTNVLQVAYTDKNSELAARIVNEVVNKYTKYRAELFKNTQAYQFFDEQIKLIENKLNQLEAAQSQYRQAQKVSEPENQALILLDKIGEFEKSFTQVKTERIGKEARLGVIKGQLLKKNSDIIIPATESSNSPSREEYLSGLKSKLADLEIERRALLTRFTPAYYDVVKMNAQIEVVQEKIKTEVQQVIQEEEIGIKALRAEESEYERKIAEMNNQLQVLMADKYEIEKLSRGVTDNRELYSMLLKQREEARISQSKQDQVIQVKILNAAAVPFRPSSPNRMLIFILGFAFAGVASLTIATVIDFFKRSIISAEDAQLCLGLPVLTNIPDLDRIPFDTGSPGNSARTRVSRRSRDWIYPIEATLP